MLHFFFFFNEGFPNAQYQRILPPNSEDKSHQKFSSEHLEKHILPASTHNVRLVWHGCRPGALRPEIWIKCICASSATNQREAFICGSDLHTLHRWKLLSDWRFNQEAAIICVADLQISTQMRAALWLVTELAQIRLIQNVLPESSRTAAVNMKPWPGAEGQQHR